MSRNNEVPQSHDPKLEEEEPHRQEVRRERSIINIHLEPAPLEPIHPHVQWVGLLPRIDRQVEKVREEQDTAKTMPSRKMEYMTKREEQRQTKKFPLRRKRHEESASQNCLEKLERMVMEDRERRERQQGQQRREEQRRPMTPWSIRQSETFCPGKPSSTWSRKFRESQVAATGKGR